MLNDVMQTEYRKYTIETTRVKKVGVREKERGIRCRGSFLVVGTCCDGIVSPALEPLPDPDDREGPDVEDDATGATGRSCAGSAASAVYSPHKAWRHSVMVKGLPAIVRSNRRR